jgi:hypothetical protein
MSDQKKQSSGTITLEQVFESREFERSQRGASSGTDASFAVAGQRQVIFTAPFGGVRQGVDPALSSRSGEDASDELEDVLLSARLGKPLRLVPPLEPAGTSPAAERAVVPFPTLSPRDNRYRAIAAVSGIAAAALVAAALSTGTGQPRPGDVAALGQRPAAQARGGFSSPGGAPTGTAAPGAGTPNAALAGANGSGAAASLLDTGTPQPSNAPGSARSVSGSPGTTVTAVSSPGVPAGPVATGPGGGTGVGTGSPAPAPPAAANPVAPVVTALGSSVTDVGTSVTTTAGQLGSSMPASATVAAAVAASGATVSQLGQTLSSTTA